MIAMTPEQYKKAIAARSRRKAGVKIPKTLSPQRDAPKTAVKTSYWLEADLQEYLVAQLNYNKYVFAASLEGVRIGRGAGKKAVKQGLKKGEPDLRIYLAGGKCLFVELKKQDGTTKPHQKARHELLRSLGFEVHVLRAPNGIEAWAELENIIKNAYV